MKRALYITIAILCFSVVSCTKFLNTAPEDFLEQSGYYDTKKKLMDALAGVYQPLANPGIYGDNMFNSLGAATDEGFYARSGQTTGTAVYNFSYGDGAINNFWSQLYIGI